MDFKNLEAYELIEDRRIDDLASEAVLLRHKKRVPKLHFYPMKRKIKFFTSAFEPRPRIPREWRISLSTRCFVVPAIFR